MAREARRSELAEFATGRPTPVALVLAVLGVVVTSASATMGAVGAFGATIFAINRAG